MRKIQDLKKEHLLLILNEILETHKNLIRQENGKWYVEDSDFGLEVKSILCSCGLIEHETIND